MGSWHNDGNVIKESGTKRGKVVQRDLVIDESF